MKEVNHIPEYIFASLKGTEDSQQKQLVKEWLKVPEKQDIYSQLRKIDQLSSDIRMFEKFNLKEGKIEVQNRINKVKVRRILSTVQKIAAILILPLLFTSLWIVFQNNNLKKDIAAAQVIQEIKSQPGVKSHFFLPDGTEVWLNTASSIKFPSVFSGNTRSIQLDGEAYFKVFKNKQKPFIVKAQNLEVTALGTAFNLCAYGQDNTFYTTLEEGKVKVINTEKINKKYILSPNEQIVFDKLNDKISKSIVDANEVIAWKDGKLIFNETPFHEVVLKLGRWFNAEIILADQSIANYRYTATFTNENLNQVMELLKLTAPIDYSSSKREILGSKEFSKEKIIIRENPGAKLN